MNSFSLVLTILSTGRSIPTSGNLDHLCLSIWLGVEKRCTVFFVFFKCISENMPHRIAHPFGRSFVAIKTSIAFL